VHDLLIHPRDGDLIAATHGRGIWIADNITPLQQITPEAVEKDIFLCDVRPEVQWATTYEFSWTTDKRFYKPNPPTGSNIAYYVKKDIPDSVVIEIADIMGEVIWSSKGSNKAGFYTVFWNFRRNPPRTTAAAAAAAPQFAGGRGMGRGGAAAPGEYLVRLQAGSTILTTKLVIEKDNPGYMGR